MKRIVSYLLACATLMLVFCLSVTADKPLDGYTVGDVDYDFQTTISDYALVRRYVVGTLDRDFARESWDICVPAMDINGDGQIDALDCLVYKRIVVGTLSLGYV